MSEQPKAQRLTSDELADVLAIFAAADRASESALPIAVMADRLFAAFDAGVRDPILLKAAVLDQPPETIKWTGKVWG